MKKQEFYNHKKPRKLLDQVRDVMRLKHYASRTEETQGHRTQGKVLLFAICPAYQYPKQKSPLSFSRNGVLSSVTPRLPPLSAVDETLYF